MLEKITKWDRRTDLDKRIDEASEVISKMKAQLDESPDINLDERIESILVEMSQVDAGSVDHLNMAKSLELLYKARASRKSKLDEYSQMNDNYKSLLEQRNKIQERKAIIKKVVIVAVAQTIGLVAVVKHEDVNVITGKAFGLIPWVRQ
jgi:hypothetical protein